MFRYFVLLAALIAAPCHAIKQHELVEFFNQLFDHVGSIPLPDIAFAELNIYANATNITLSELSVSDLSLTIPDQKHMALSLTAMTGELDMDLLAGITGPIPIKRNDKVKGAIAEMNMDITFEVGNGDAKMSNIKVKIGSLKIDFGSDQLAQLLANLFLPFLITTLQSIVPTVILLFKNDLDLDHLISLFLKYIPSAVLPDLTLTEVGYDIQISDVKIASLSALANTFSIKGQQLVFDVSNLKASGGLDFKIGKVGDEQETGQAVMQVVNAQLEVVAEIKHTDGELEIVFVSAFQNIESLTLTTTSKSPLAQWLMVAVAPMVKSFLEQGFVFLMNALFSV